MISMFTHGLAVEAVARLAGARPSDLEVAGGDLRSGFLRVCRKVDGDASSRGWMVYRNVEVAVDAHARELANTLENVCITAERCSRFGCFTMRQMFEALLRHSKLEGLDHWVTVRCRFLRVDPDHYLKHLKYGLDVFYEVLGKLSEVSSLSGEDNYYEHLYWVVWHQCEHDNVKVAEDLVRAGGGLIPRHYIKFGLGRDVHVLSEGFFIETKELAP